MQISKAQNNNVNFGIRVSNNLLDKAQNMYHYKNVPNKRNLIWQFNKKAEQFEHYGYDNYTLTLEVKTIGQNKQHSLIATDNINPEKKIVVAKRKSLQDAVNRFLEINRKDFRMIMYNGEHSKKFKA